jgi:hypothetical protein
MVDAGRAPLDRRDQFIPVRRADIFAALFADCGFKDAGMDEQAGQVCRLVTAIIHFEYMGELERLRDAYHYFNPALSHNVPFGPDVLEAAYGDLTDALRHVLTAANFVEIDREEIDRAGSQGAAVKYKLRSGIDDFREVKLFRRGHHVQPLQVKEWFGFRTRSRNVEVYDDVVLLAATKPPSADPAGVRRAKPRRSRTVRPGTVMIKYFHDIASADLDTLFPDVRVVMNWTDRMMIGLPALFGGIPLAIKIAPAFIVLYGLLRFYFGMAGPTADDGLKEALIVTSGVLALGGFLMHQWMKYERQSLKYQKEINENIYFHNVNNNAGIFDHLIGAAEEQDCKEALLAYFFLLAAGRPVAQAELDAWIEGWLNHRFGLDIDFEVDDALAKLDRFGVLLREGDALSVPSLPDALRRLDYQWDNFFQFNVAEA